MTRYRGKDRHMLKVYSAYRPNPPNGPFTVYAQQNGEFNSKGSPRCPWVAFIEDFTSSISEALKKRDHVIILIDGISNMKSSDLQLALAQLHLREAILDKYGLEGPKTLDETQTGLQ